MLTQNAPRYGVQWLAMVQDRLQPLPSPGIITTSVLGAIITALSVLFTYLYYLKDRTAKPAHGEPAVPPAETPAAAPKPPTVSHHHHNKGPVNYGPVYHVYRVSTPDYLLQIQNADEYTVSPGGQQNRRLQREIARGSADT